MEIEKEGKRIILDFSEDYQYIKLIHYLVKTNYGDLTITVKNGKPIKIIEIQKNILLEKFDIGESP